jgi:hypothetical protein
MKKLLLICGLIFIILPILGIVFIIHNRMNTNPFVTTFHSRLSKGVQYHQKIFFPDLTIFKWEKVCFVEPYEPPEKIQEKIGAEYQLEPFDNHNEGSYWIVFTLPNKHILPIPVSRSFYILNRTYYCMSNNESQKTPLAF